jgi:hypothetical protein
MNFFKEIWTISEKLRIDPEEVGDYSDKTKKTRSLL